MRWMVASVVLSALLLTVIGCGGSNTATDQETTQAVATETAPEVSTEEPEDGETVATPEAEGSELFGACQDLAAATEKYEAALGGGLAGDDLTESAAALSAVAEAAPEEIRPSFKILAKAVTAYAKALEGVDLSSTEAPDPETLAKVLGATELLGTAEFGAAAAKIGTWTTENCTP